MKKKEPVFFKTPIIWWALGGFVVGFFIPFIFFINLLAYILDLFSTSAF
jgi:hypothetical protein